MKLEDVDAAVYHIDIPLLRPFKTASGRVLTRTVGVVSVSRDGVFGWGEAAPFPGQDEPFREVLEAARSGRRTPTLEAAIDEALSDLMAREDGESLSSALGVPQESIPISVAAGLGSESIAALDDLVAAGVTAVKVKIMPGNTGHVAEIRSRFPDLTIGVDGNGSFDRTNWRQIVTLAHLDIAYVEQPTASLDRNVAQGLADAGFAVFADESVRSVDDAAAVLRIDGVAGVVVKPGRLGWSDSLAVVAMAREAGKRWRASGLLETGIGRAYTEALAAAPDAYTSDVADAMYFFEFDVVDSRATDGRIAVATGRGSGVDIDLARVQALAKETIRLTG